jgi:hypothetical protein
MRVWTGFIWLRIGTQGDDPLFSIKCSFQERILFCRVNLISILVFVSKLSKTEVERKLPNNLRMWLIQSVNFICPVCKTCLL